MYSAAEKYVIRYLGQEITKKARRQDAHALCHRLGPDYEVWNTYTRQVST